jgi:hypothetical protein
VVKGLRVRGGTQHGRYHTSFEENVVGDSGGRTQLVGVRHTHSNDRVVVGSRVLRASHYVDVDGFGASGFNVVQNSNLW